MTYFDIMTTGQRNDHTEEMAVYFAASTVIFGRPRLQNKNLQNKVSEQAAQFSISGR